MRFLPGRASEHSAFVRELLASSNILVPDVLPVDPDDPVPGCPAEFGQDDVEELTGLNVGQPLPFGALLE